MWCEDWKSDPIIYNVYHNYPMRSQNPPGIIIIPLGFLYNCRNALGIGQK